MRWSLPLVAAVAAVCLFTPTVASAAFFPAAAVDGPSADIVSVGDLDVARDGQGAVVYLRRVDGVPHVFISRLTAGSFGAPQRLDGDLAGAASQPVVGVADGGRLAVAFVSDGTLLASVYDPKARIWSPLQALGAGVSNPSLDLSIHGAGFLTYTAGGDVRAARLERTTQQFAPIGAVLDLDPAQDAGSGAGRPRVAIGADGTAVAVWGENGRVIARRLYRTSISTAPADLTLADLEGRSGGAADLPEVAIEDDSSFAHVAFRQAFTDASGSQTRAVVRRLRGSAVEAPVVVDGAGWGGAQVDRVDVDMNGRGEGAAATGMSDGVVVSAILKDNRFVPGLGVGAAGGVAMPRIATAETTQRVISWMQPSDGSVRSRFYEDKASVRTLPTPGPETVASTPEFGPVDPNGGLETASDRVGDFVTVYIQGSGAERRLVASVFDRAPGEVTLYTRAAWRNPVTSPLSWSEAVDLWGGPTYIVSIDGREVGRTTDTTFTIPPAALVADGVHTWKVTTTDLRGQASASDQGSLRLDSVAPTALMTLGRTKRTVTVTLTAADVLPASGRASGVATTLISFGDGRPPVPGPRATVTYPGKRRGFTITATVKDKAGNVAKIQRKLTLPKPKKSSKKKKTS